MSLIFSGETVYAGWDDNILVGGTVSATVAASASYTLGDVVSPNPAVRVRFGVRTNQITVTLAQPARGDVFAWPWTNLDETGGSPSTGLRISNGSGLDEAVTAPTRQGNGLPNTAVLDLTTAEPNAATRTSNVWHFDFQDNATNLILGGGLAIFGTKRVLSPDLRWGFAPSKRAFRTRTMNDYGTTYTVEYETAIRSLKFSLRTADLAGFEAWFDEMVAGPLFLWPQITGLDAYLGHLEDTFEAANVEGTNLFDIAGVFTELSKGKPV